MKLVYGLLWLHPVEANPRTNWTIANKVLDTVTSIGNHDGIRSRTYVSTVTSELHDLMSAQSRERVGSWHGNRIVVQYVQGTGNYTGVQVGQMTNVTQEVKAMGLAYLKYDKVLL